MLPWSANSMPFPDRPSSGPGVNDRGACAAAIASLIHACGLVLFGAILGLLLAQPCAWQAVQTRATAALVSLASGVSVGISAAPYAGALTSRAPRQARSDATDDGKPHAPDRSVLPAPTADAPILDVANDCPGLAAPLPGAADVSARFAGTLMRMRSRCPR